MSIFTAIFRDDDAWVIFDRCRRVYLPSERGGDQTWATYEQAAEVCAELNQDDTARSNGVWRWSSCDQAFTRRRGAHYPATAASIPRE